MDVVEEQAEDIGDKMIRVENLTFKYDDTLVLDQIDLSFCSNGVYGILGPNGAGKSTLLKVLGKILKVESGHIFLDDRDINQYSRMELARKVAYVPQQFVPQYAFTVQQLLEMGRHPYHGQFDEISQDEKRLIGEAVCATGLVGMEDHFITELSGGELQRVMIARAIVQDTPVIILDEPISHLDIHFQQGIIHMLQRISREKNKLVITVLHDMNVGLNYCDYIHLIHNHTVVSGKPEEVLTLDRLKDIYGINLVSVSNGDKSYIQW